MLIVNTKVTHECSNLNVFNQSDFNQFNLCITKKYAAHYIY